MTVSRVSHISTSHDGCISSQMFQPSPLGHRLSHNLRFNRTAVSQLHGKSENPGSFARCVTSAMSWVFSYFHKQMREHFTKSFQKHLQAGRPCHQGLGGPALASMAHSMVLLAPALAPHLAFSLGTDNCMVPSHCTCLVSSQFCPDLSGLSR
jgi:hypothetical protein